ncbi:Uncharacterised protein [Streptococcus pneumoniae]|nr:Uncharacterised protein [Streptococcus pneumoniae]
MFDYRALVILMTLREICFLPISRFTSLSFDDLAPKKGDFVLTSPLCPSRVWFAGLTATLKGLTK